MAQHQLRPGGDFFQVFGWIAGHGDDARGQADAANAVDGHQAIREGIRAVQQGRDPLRPAAGPDGMVATYCRNTILKVPSAEGVVRPDLLQSTMRRVAATVLQR